MDSDIGTWEAVHADVMVHGRSGPSEDTTMVQDGVSDGVVALMRGNARGAKAVSQCVRRGFYSHKFHN